MPIALYKKRKEQDHLLYFCINMDSKLGWARLYWCVHGLVCIMLANIFWHL